MLKSTHIAICPDTDTAFLCTADMNDGRAAIYHARVYANAYHSYAFQ